MFREQAKLIVIDPRRTETARRAHVHLQSIPGEDPTILAGLIHLVIASGRFDRDFIRENTQGFDRLKAAMEAEGRTRADLASLIGQSRATEVLADRQRIV